MDDRAQILKDWIEREGRRQDWVAKQVGVSPQWINYVVRGKKPLSDRLARVLHEKLGVQLFGDEQTTNNKPMTRVSCLKPETAGTFPVTEKKLI